MPIKKKVSEPISDVASLANALECRRKTNRSITAIAGPPGAGKSTISLELARHLNAQNPCSAAVFQMDGFHYDDSVLDAKGLRARKGAPQTFDVGGFSSLLGRLRANTETEIAVPVFDRSIETARAGAAIIPQTAQHVIVEGNYLLLALPPWQVLQVLYDTTVFLHVPFDVLRNRLSERWKKLNTRDLQAKLEGNDLPNVRLVDQNSNVADFTLSQS